MPNKLLKSVLDSLAVVWQWSVCVRVCVCVCVCACVCVMEILPVMSAVYAFNAGHAVIMVQNTVLQNSTYT